jgi:transcription elongation factor Elf1
MIQPVASGKQDPGLQCPQCKNLIRLTIEDLLSRDRFFCGCCGLELKLDRSRSKRSLDLMAKVHEAMESVDKVKKRYR